MPNIATFNEQQLTCTIAGNIVELEPNTLSCTNTIGQRSQTTFDYHDFVGVLYGDGAVVEITDPSGNLIYSGFVDQDKAIWQGTTPISMYHRVSCKDNQFYAERRVIATSYQAGLTAGYVAEDLFHNYLASEGVTIGGIAAGPILPALIYNYRQLSQALSTLAKQSGYWWNIDQYKQFWFMPYTGMSAPWTYDGTQSDNSGSYKPTLSTGNPEYRNRQYVVGGMDVTKDQYEYFVGNGTVMAFTLRYEASGVKGIYRDGVWQTVGTKGTLGSQWYWAVGDSVIAQDSSGTPLASTETLEVWYNGRYPIVALAQSNSQITYRQSIEGGGTGYFENTLRDTKIYTLSDAFLIASGELAHFGTTMRTLTFRTAINGLQEGQLLNVYFPSFCGLIDSMLIQTCEIREVDEVIWYYITAIGSPSDITWQSFFQGLVNNADGISASSISTDQALALLIQADGTINLTGTGVIASTWNSPIISPTLIIGPTLLVG